MEEEGEKERQREAEGGRLKRRGAKGSERERGRRSGTSYCIKVLLAGTLYDC